MNRRAIVMAGGSGQRLWPVSTASLPKQFCKITSKKTLLQETLERLDFLDASQISISSTENYRGLLEKDYPKRSLIIEPSSMDTAPAICLCALSGNEEEDEILAFIPSDHYIADKKAFQNDLKKAFSFFESHNEGMLLIGVTPTFPADGYGYIKGHLDDSGFGKVANFREKPSVIVAKRYIEEGDYYWNSGMFFFRRSFMSEIFQKEAPSIFSGVKAYLETKDPQHYASVEKISFDFAIVEKIKNHIHFMSNGFDWSDVGSWNSLGDLFEDADGNYNAGGAKLVNSKNTLVVNDSQFKIVLNSLNHLNVIVSNSTIYIESKKDALNIKDLLKKL